MAGSYHCLFNNPYRLLIQYQIHFKRQVSTQSGQPKQSLECLILELQELSIY